MRVLIGIWRKSIYIMLHRYVRYKKSRFFIIFVIQAAKINAILFLGRIKDPVDPCLPSPCGPYSVCRESHGYSICSCQEQYFGSPPFCRPECMVSSDCMPNRACINQICVDPCIGSCGNNAKCMVVNHNALCSCPQNYVGDPFVHCVYEDRKCIKNISNDLTRFLTIL